MLVAPGASYSTADVYNGYKEAFRREGHTVVEYDYTSRLGVMNGWLTYSWRRSKLGKEHKPNWNDAMYWACYGILERALRHEVDWVVIISSTMLDINALILMNKAHIKTAAVLTESPYYYHQEDIIARFVDVVFTNDSSAVEHFKNINPYSYYLPTAYNPAIHYVGVKTPFDGQAIPHDVVFVGTGFEERKQLLSEVDWTGIDLGLYGAWHMLGSRHRLRKYIRQNVVDNAFASELYKVAKINLSLHRTSTELGKNVVHIYNAESLGPRDYELAALGCFFISDYRKEVEEKMPMVPIFHDAKELESLCRYYLKHDDERLAIAAALPDTVQNDTYDNRVKSLIATLSEFKG